MTISLSPPRRGFRSVTVCFAASIQNSLKSDVSKRKTTDPLTQQAGMAVRYLLENGGLAERILLLLQIFAGLRQFFAPNKCAQQRPNMLFTPLD